MISFLTLAFGFCLIVFTRSFTNVNIGVHIMILLFSMAFIFDLSKSKKYKKYELVLFFGYLFRVALLYYDVYTDDPFHIPLLGGEFSSDPRRFYYAAILYMQGQTTNYGGFFPKALGYMFKLTGPSRLLCEFIVLLFAIGTILVLITILEELDIDQSYKKKGACLIAFLPNFALLSACLRRETIITFFIAVSILWFIRWFRGKNGGWSFFLAIIFALAASLFHGATGLIAGSYIFIRIIYSPKKKAFTLDLMNIFGAVFFLIAVLFVYSRYGDVFFTKIEDRLESGVYATTRDAGGSSYAQYVGDATTPTRMIIYAVPRFVFFMFSPFPTQWRGLSDVLTFFLSSFVYFLIIYNSFRYIIRSPKSDNYRALMIALMIVAFLSAFIFSWGVSNTGTATRHRDKFIAIYTIMFAIGQKTRLRIKLNRTI